MQHPLKSGIMPVIILHKDLINKAPPVLKALYLIFSDNDFIKIVEVPILVG